MCADRWRKENINMDLWIHNDPCIRRAVMQTPLGYLRIEAENDAITRVDFVEEATEMLPEDALLKKTIAQLKEYFAGSRTAFDVPLQPRGTAFQQAAWRALQSIPYGETITYGEEAARMGDKKAARAVGGANRRNPIAIIIPCHRVVAANGVGGYASGIDRKCFLLELEKQNKKRAASD